MTDGPEARASHQPEDQELTRRVLASLAAVPDPRLRELLIALTGHLHDFARQTRLTLAEWEYAIGFLTRAGQWCGPDRQEFILLSDVLGLSSLTETLNEAPGGTEATVLGPFHQAGAPRRELGESIDLVGSGPPCLISGRVTDPEGSPLPGAELDVWQASYQGFYDVQQPGTQPRGNLRGRFATGPDGRYWFRTALPGPYPVPDDGPAGDLLKAAGRHPYRPAHVHFRISAPGFRPLTTHLFVAGGEYLDSDAVFAVKRSLVAEFTRGEDDDGHTIYQCRYDFIITNYDAES